MSNDYEGYKPCNFDNECSTTTTQHVNVCVPVEVKPFADVGKIKTQCVGKPVVAECGKCEGEKNKTCKFTITQKIKVDIPVVFGADTETGEAHIKCKCDEPFCKDCFPKL